MEKPSSLKEFMEFKPNISGFMEKSSSLMEFMEFKPKRRSRNERKKYLRRSALTQLHYSRTTLKTFADMVKKRVLVLDSENEENDLPCNKGTELASQTLSPERTSFSPTVESIDGIKLQKLSGTPRTPQTNNCDSESRLESLPIELLVEIICHLHHDQLRAVFHVSQRIRKAVLFARQCHFNYTTPDRSRQETLRMKTPLPTEHEPFVSKGDMKGIWNSVRRTPKAPRHGPRPLSRLNLMEAQPIHISFELHDAPKASFGF